MVSLPAAPLSSTIELESRDEVNPVAKEESRGDEEVFEVFETFRAESASAEVVDPPPGSSSAFPPPGSSNPFTTELMDPSPGTLSSAPPPGSSIFCDRHFLLIS